MKQVAVILLMLCIFGGYMADAREVHYKLTCGGSKCETRVHNLGYEQYGSYLVLACCPKGTYLHNVSGNIFCCSGSSLCFGGVGLYVDAMVKKSHMQGMTSKLTSQRLYRRERADNNKRSCHGQSLRVCAYVFCARTGKKISKVEIAMGEDSSVEHRS